MEDLWVARGIWLWGGVLLATGVLAIQGKGIRDWKYATMCYGAGIALAALATSVFIMVRL